RRPPPTPPLFPYTTLFRSLDREPARPLGGGAPGRLGRGLELYHRLATARDAVDLGHQLVAPADQVLDRAGELAFQARELRQALRSEEHTSELQSRVDLVCR